MKTSRTAWVAGLVWVAILSSPVWAGLIGGNVSINGSGAFPDVAYDSVDGKYLAVWYGGSGVQGRFVSNAGATIGSTFGISDGSTYALFPAIAYNATSNEFLVTWDDGRGPDTIYAQRVRGSDGALLGGNFQTVSVSGAGRSSVAWSSTSNAYLVVAFNWSEVYARRVSSTGTALGSTFNVSNDAAFSGYPGVGYGSSGNQYLVTWDHDDGSIRGQRVDATNGTLLGGQITVMTGSLDRSASAYDTVNNRWMVEANLHGNSYDQRGQLVSTTGTLIGSPVNFVNTSDFEGDTQYGGDICYIPGMNRFFVNTSNSGTYEGQSGIEYNNATGTIISFKNLLGVGFFPSNNCAADTSLNRYLSVWMVQGGGIMSQLYAASSTAVPGQAGSPNPANGGVGFPISGTPGWTAGSGATSRNVYFGTTNPPLYATTTSGTSHAPTLAWDTIYYWQVNEVSDGGTRQGPVWSFNTKSIVSINLGNTNIEDLMTSPTGGDGDTIGALNIGGRECRRNMDPGFNDHYFYFSVGDAWAYQGNKQDVWFAVDYYDNATGGAITLNYDANSSAYKDGGSVLFTGTNAWKTQKWHVADAYLGNRENNAADFRIHVGNVIRYLDGATVQQKTPGTVPPGQAGNPSPSSGSTTVNKNDDLSWTAGAGASSHNVYFGTTNPPPLVGVQSGATYDPGAMTPGATYYWRVDEYISGGGTTTGPAWSFTVRASVSIDLGSTNVQNGMTSPVGGDGDTVGATIGGRECRRNMDPGYNDAYFYFTVDDTYAFQGNNPDQWITIDYYNNAASGSLALQYDGTSSAYQSGGSVTLTGTSTWKQYTFHLTDAYFDNRQNNAADFRIFTGGGVTRYLDIVMVSQSAPAPGPGAASAPSPANAATGVAIGADLAWTPGSGAVSHDVFFGTTNPPSFVANQAGAAYEPGTLSTGTTYYWRIDEVEASGVTTSGGVWSFTTLPLPGLASNPSPANSATSVSINADLSWTAGSSAVEHDVYWGTTNPPAYRATQAGTIYDPGAMAYNTTYYWRIDEVNGSGVTTGTVWSFTTESAAPVAFFESAFNTGGDGWSIAVWKAGPYSNGEMYFVDTSGNPPGSMKCLGSGGSNNTDRCTREGGEIYRTVSTVDYDDILVEYEVRFETNQTGTSCIGSCTVLEGDCADKLAVYYSTNGTSGPWTLLEQVYASSVTQNTYVPRSLDLSAVSGVNNNANFALRFIFQFNQSSDIGRLDNISVTGTP